MGEFRGSGKAFLTESGEGRASGDVRGSGGGGQVPGPAPHQPPPGASFPRNFRKHLRMVGSRRVKAQTFAERRERSFSRSWSDPTPMKADTSHDSRDSRCPVQASPSLPEAPLGPQPRAPQGGPPAGAPASALLLSDPQFAGLGKLRRPAPLTSWAGLTNSGRGAGRGLPRGSARCAGRVPAPGGQSGRGLSSSLVLRAGLPSLELTRAPWLPPALHRGPLAFPARQLLAGGSGQGCQAGGDLGSTPSAAPGFLTGLRDRACQLCPPPISGAAAQTGGAAEADGLPPW